MNKRYDRAGSRLTDCCGAYSTFMDPGDGSWELSCRKCCKAVEPGEGDGSERAPSTRCPDCGEPGERKGHQTCQYPQD